MTNILAGRTHQYLRSEYIQPPPGPPSLDAKKSPLALLAQTCSAIGKDSTKGRVSSMNKKENPDSPSSPHRSSVHTSNSKESSSSSECSETLRGKCGNASNVSTSRISVSKMGHPARKMSTPVFSKTSMEILPPPCRTSPTILQTSERNFRTLSSTPIGMSDESSPDPGPNKKHFTSMNHRESDKRLGNNARYSPKDQMQKLNSTTPEKVASGGEGFHHKRTKRSSDPHTCNTRSDIGLRPSQRNSSPICSMPSHPAMCGCTIKSSKVNRLEYPLESGKAVKSSYAHLASPCDRLCVGCQIPHVPGACEMSTLKQAEVYYPFYPFDVSSTAPVVGLPPTLPSYNSIQSQLVWAAMAARNEYLGPGESSAHVCKWVTATEGNCGKRFGTREELLEHLSTHALPPNTGSEFNSSYSNLVNSSMSPNPLAAYFSNPAFGLSGSSPSNISVSNHLTNVALANERFLQSSQRRCSPLYRYHPYKTGFSNTASPYLPIYPSHAASSGLYGSPYSLYSQAVGAANGFVFP